MGKKQKKTADLEGGRYAGYWLRRCTQTPDLMGKVGRLGSGNGDGVVDDRLIELRDQAMFVRPYVGA